VQTIHLETELPASADKVWQAMCHPASFTYITRGLIGVPALAGRTEPFREGETGTGWLLLFHLIPLHRHTITWPASTTPPRPCAPASTAACSGPGTTSCASSPPASRDAATATRSRSMPAR
jgi:hypothetical protein